MSNAFADVVPMLPPAWIDRIFLKLQTRYGSSWLAKWAGVDMQGVRNDWAEELAGFSGQPEAIRYALEHLPVDRPPNVAEFKALCNQAPPPPVAGLITNQPARRPPPPGVAEKLRAFQVRVTNQAAMAAGSEQ